MTVSSLLWHLPTVQTLHLIWSAFCHHWISCSPWASCYGTCAMIFNNGPWTFMVVGKDLLLECDINFANYHDHCWRSVAQHTNFRFWGTQVLWAISVCTKVHTCVLNMSYNVTVVTLTLNQIYTMMIMMRMMTMMKISPPITPPAIAPALQPPLMVGPVVGGGCDWVGDWVGVSDGGWVGVADGVAVESDIYHTPITASSHRTI